MYKLVYQKDGKAFTKELNLISFCEKLITDIEIGYYSDLEQMKQELEMDLAIFKTESGE